MVLVDVIVIISWTKVNKRRRRTVAAPAHAFSAPLEAMSTRGLGARLVDLPAHLAEHDRNVVGIA
jgi:hypothetical protein